MSILNGIDTKIDQWLGLADEKRYGTSHRKYATAMAAPDLSAKGGPLGDSSDGNLLVELLNRIDDNWINGGEKQLSRKNWVLRKSLTLASHNESPEVNLERNVALLCDDDWSKPTWFNQIATCSGMVSSTKDKRRQIDLVHCCKRGEYEFIELKYANGDKGNFGADNPLRAAWEIVVYGLLYAHSRQRRLQGEGGLTTAKSVHLVVLAPEGYYRFTGEGGRQCSYKFGWLEKTLNKWLQAKEIRSHIRMDFQFQEFTAQFDEVYNKAMLLPVAIRAFRDVGISHRKPVY
jgi:hypothetical protein